MKSYSLVIIPQKLCLTEYFKTSTPRIHFHRDLLLMNPSLILKTLKIEMNERERERERGEFGMNFQLNFSLYLYAKFSSRSNGPRLVERDLS
jgi:cellulose synthase/poly-beta-1,6-N-acetylglucosamine synthase-like glycosyltransferase